MHNDGTADGSLDIRILGPLEVRRGGRLLPLGGHRQQAVLACLVVSRAAAVSTERLADAIWGEAPPAAYLPTLQTYIYHLRETLEPGRAKGSPARILVTATGGYRLLVPDEDVDACRFERLVTEGQRLVQTNPAKASEQLGQALGLWRDDVLSEFSDLEPVSREATRLGEVRQAAFEAWAAAELALGHHSALVPELGRLVSSYPLREGMHGQRILALYRDGRQAEALAAYRQLRSTLDDELGVEPSPAIRQLHEGILRHDPSLLVAMPRGAGPEPEQRDSGSAAIVAPTSLGSPAPTSLVSPAPTSLGSPAPTSLGSPGPPMRSRWRLGTAVAALICLAPVLELVFQHYLVQFDSG